MQPRLTSILGPLLGVLCFVQPAAPSANAAPSRLTLDLAGEWRVRLDDADAGLPERWFERPLDTRDRLRLPGTTDAARLGHALDPDTLRYPAPFPYTRFPGVKETDRADERGFLARPHMFLGPAWYEREFEIPTAWANHTVTLRLERVIWQSDVWIDGRPLGAANSLVASHQYRLGRLDPGRHRLTVRVDNRMILNLSTITHGYGPETQSRWNGIVGRIELTAAPPVAIRRLEVFPAPDRRAATVRVLIENSTPSTEPGHVTLRLAPLEGRPELASTQVPIEAAGSESWCEATLRWSEPAQPWDEFNPVRYRVEAGLEAPGQPASLASATFGFRQIERQGRAIHVNGRRVFLRGTLDCAVYPRTAHPPMTVPEWERVFHAVKRHGFNHVRFHTWCPPEAAFEAADRLGLYLMPETATWVDDWTRETYSRPPAIGRDPAINEFIRAEIRRVLEAYGNHPSFAFFCIGNEFGMQGTDWDAVAAWTAEAKRLDPRRLYSGTTARRSLAPDEFWVTHDAHGKGTRGVGPARTDWDFREAAHATTVPLIAHETGQRPVFPDYADLLPKFTGPLDPLNYRRLRDALEAAGLAGQTREFERASARFQFVQYKAEHEAMRRTPDYAGYQLLMLNDFTGQSEALVGILDPFYEEKGIVSAPEVRAWNDVTVPLARFSRYTWAADEEFAADLEVAHHGPADLEAATPRWELNTADGRRLGGGRLGPVRIPTGAVTHLGSVRVALSGLDRAAALTLELRVGKAINHWPLWAYPQGLAAAPADVVVAQRFDDTVERALGEGRAVLLLAHGARGPRAARTGFESVYWSAGWWGNAFSSLGIVCDPRHPALGDFPNAGHSDWQWHDLTQGATTWRLEGAPPGYRPIVQPVPDFHFNRLLAQVFEARVGRGRLLVCGYDLTTDLERRHAARQFRRSLLRYAGSTRFQPRTELPLAFLRELFGGSNLARLGARVIEADSEDRAHGNVASNVIDGDPATHWHTRWQPQNDPMPHHLVVDLGAARTLKGLVYLPRQDQANGRVARADVYASDQPGDWGAPALSVTATNDGERRVFAFPQPVRARYLKFAVTAEVNGNPFAAVAELDVLE